jgi:hypothetical protein
MLQTGWFKFTRMRTGTGRRIFLMAPLHHHFEKKGWYESQVVMRFYILCVLFAVVALATLKLMMKKTQNESGIALNKSRFASCAQRRGAVNNFRRSGKTRAPRRNGFNFTRRRKIQRRFQPRANEPNTI